MKFLWAFVIGGLICAVGQVLIDKTKLTPARILVGYVCAGILLGAFGVYDKLIDFAGSGAALPLSGFGNLLVNGTREAVLRDGLIGALEGPFTAAGAPQTTPLPFQINTRWCGSMAEQLIRNEQVVSSILTTSSTPQSLV